MSNSNQSLMRGLAILELLDETPDTLGIRDIARTLDLSPTIVQRLVHSLVDANFARQDPQTQKYTIGYRALALGRSLLTEERLVPNALPELTELANDHHLNAYLSVISDGELTYVLAEQSAGPIAIKIRPGSKALYHTTAMGKALLAGKPRKEVEGLLADEPLTAVTKATITDPDLFFAALERVDAQGYALAEGENLDGVTSVGARIRDVHGHVVAAISVAYAPSLQPATQMETVVNLVTSAAGRISLALGCPEEKLDQVTSVVEASGAA